MYNIIKKVIYFGSQNLKEFNFIQFIVELIVFLSLTIILLINLDNNIVEASCGLEIKLLIGTLGLLLSTHLAYYQATHITWKYKFPKNRPPAIPQILIYTIFYLGFIVILCNLLKYV